MIIVQAPDRTVTLEHWSIERSTSNAPVDIRALLLVETPQMTPTEMRIQVEFRSNDIPYASEYDLGGFLLMLLHARFP
jgi:hypothetical protein